MHMYAYTEVTHVGQTECQFQMMEGSGTVRKRKIQLRRWDILNLGLIQGVRCRGEGDGISLMSGQYFKSKKQEGHYRRRKLHFIRWQVGKLVSDYLE